MKLKKWFEIRGPKFVWQRGTSLLERYELRPDKAIDRIKCCVDEMGSMGCSPTFPTPGIIVERYPKFIRSLQDDGAEIAVHGYHHINLRDLPVSDAVQQFFRAVRTFERYGINVHGFRCPYMGCSDELTDSLPAGVFEYSSNQAINWGWSVKKFSQKNENLFFDTLDRFYKPEDSCQKVCLPWMSSDKVEIPVCVPDDLQLFDGLQFDSAELVNAWEKILHQIYLRGELFTLLFHTELAALCNSAFSTLIQFAQRYQPKVWITRLQDLNDWWREKSKFMVDITNIATGLRIEFKCTSRATILVRGLGTVSSEPIWEGKYHRLHSNVLEISAKPRPFVGIASDVPEGTINFLRNQGYILDSSKEARFCGIYLDNNVLSSLTNDLALVDYIETSQTPLVRFWRWPNGTKCAMSITGDLDALSLIDYGSRLFIH
jgi:hypothetical protein